ncbi:hypothetical protein [Amycolatopsis anabasis]|uniref:hypothetical protein n=1 Tax=Amycolatopsis anabasis TaxID=1840409 RepID=UPI00131E2909|nr:hypothetical protein [Amycolatopsis anabasis]
MATTPLTQSPTPSAFGGGPYPSRRARLIALSVLAGFALTVLWSARFVDRVIGDNVANTLLGHDARETPISGAWAGALFAFVTGLAGSFTACNVAAFGAVAPLVGEQAPGRRRLGQTLKPVGWIAVGTLAVSAAYGVLVALVGTRMPQFATTPGGGGLSPRGIQSMVVFGVIGLAFLALGLISTGVLRTPATFRRHPNAPLVLLGALIGGFLIGRPYPLFRIMFRDAAESHNVFYGAGAFLLQSAGNIALMVVLFLLLTYVAGDRLRRWFARGPARVATVTGSALLVGGTFTLFYWVLRSLGRAGIIWYPAIGW